MCREITKIIEMKKLIGNKQFYKMVLAVAVPIMIQNGITNFVSLLDNVMVGAVGTEQMSGVAIVNQLIFVYNLCVFGAVSGAGIFTAQFFGQKNHEGVRNTFRYKLVACGIATILAILIFILFGEDLILLYLHEGSTSGSIKATLKYGQEYLWIMLTGLIPFVIVQAYASTLRETGETMMPMRAGVVAVFVNLILNYILIFGKFGAPVLGASGAAIATVISRFVECAIVVIWTHKHKAENTFIDGAYRTLKMPASLAGKITIKGMPLLVNETLWGLGMATLMQSYSVRGLAVVAGLNISSTIANIFNISFIALGSSVAIVVGQLLGAGKMEEAKDTAYKMIAFSVASCIALGVIMILMSPLFPKFYNTSDEVRELAKGFIIISACAMPLQAFLHASYFTIRSGGKTLITFLFDGVYMWVFTIPIAYCLTRFTSYQILPIYFVCQFSDIVKCIVGYVLVKKGVWLHNIVGKQNEPLNAE